MTFTLDTNCLIDLEENRPEAVFVRMLADAHRSGFADVAVATVTASERQKDGGFLEDYRQFEERLDALDLAHLRQVMPIAHWDVSFYGHGVMADEAMAGHALAIHAVLHPETPLDYREYCEKEGIDWDAKPRDTRWRNRLCDTQVAWAHAHNRRDVLVTSDRNFLKSTKQLGACPSNPSKECSPAGP